MYIGTRIKKARKEKKITQKQLSELINKNVRTIQKYENGEIEKIPFSTLMAIGRALGISVYDIVDTQNNYIQQNRDFMKAIENEELCTTIAMEECSELIQAISKAKRGKLDTDNMAEEIADVLIGIEWIKEIYSIDTLEVQKWINYKQNRIVTRLENKEFN
jgi:transcriptional regulator with XRE-family HTH domain